LGSDQKAGAETPAAENVASTLALRKRARESSTTSDLKGAARAAPQDEPPTIALAAGTRLFEYRIDAVLGQGGFGITYLATDVNLNAKVAIKEYLPRLIAWRDTDSRVLPRSEEWEESYAEGLHSYLTEARTLATFRHPNIVRVARFFEANGTAYIVLEYERGQSLKTWWESRDGIGERNLLALFVPLLDGLATVHTAGFLHRDIKPDNIYVRDDDGSLVLLDFGAARQAEHAREGDTALFTPGYAPIEQYMNGEQGPWTDIYALGATFYWLIGREPAVDALDRTGEEDPLKPAVTIGRERYGAKFLQAVDWALQPRAKDRPRDVNTLRKALYAEHAAALNLKDALAFGESESRPTETWLATLKSPRIARARIARFGRALVRPGSWPMAVRLTLAMMATALVPMLITAKYNLNASVDRVRQSEIQNLEQLASSLAGRVTQLVVDSKHAAEYLATDDDFVGFIEHPTPEQTTALKTKLDRLVQANPDVQLAIVFSKDGTALVSSDPEVTGKNFKFRDYFKASIAGRPFITGIVVGAVSGQPGVFFANPVRNPTNEVIGAVTLRIKGQSIAAILEAAHQGARTPFLIDGDGVLIHHPDPARLYQSLVPLSPEALAAIKADRRFRRDTIESVNMPDLANALVHATSRGYVSYTSTISGKEEIAGYAPVRAHDWVVGVTESRETFEGPLNKLFRNVLKSVALVGAVSLLLAMLFARTIVRPIERLTRAVHALKRGDYDNANVKVTSGDEVGQLARVFNVMIDVLRQRDRDPGGRKNGPNSRRGS
jgi:serine/threonine protein kinase/HAMP domain-containing protein